MIELTPDELKQRFSDKIFKQISETADDLGLECYVVGGYVRDIFLQRPSKDIDVVVVGSGIAMAEALGRRLGKGAHVSVVYQGERSYTTQMTPADRQAAASVYELSKVLSAITEIKTNLEEAHLKIQFVQKKMSERKTEAE